ncbi:hypothetical protein BDF14DRAFT_1727254, partial [Spinellus fusiger]
LIVGEVNIKNILKKFRNKNIRVAKNKDINSTRILSLSFIFPVDKFSNSRCILYHFNEDEVQVNRSIVFFLLYQT